MKTASECAGLSPADCVVSDLPERARAEALARILGTIHSRVRPERVDGQSAWMFIADDGLTITAHDRELRLSSESHDMASLAFSRLNDALRAAGRPFAHPAATDDLAKEYLDGAEVYDVAVTFGPSAAHVTVRMTLPRSLERLSIIEALAGSLLPQQDASLLAAGAAHVRELLAPGTPAGS